METVAKDCLHEDCAYRAGKSTGDTCDYILITGKPRGCLISQCDKYRPGRKKRSEPFDGYRFGYTVEIIEDNED